MATTIGEIAQIVSERVDPRIRPRARYVGLEHLDSGVPHVERWASTEGLASSTTPFSVGDTLFGRLRPYLRKGARAQFDGVCTPEILVLRCRPKVDDRYLSLLVVNDSTFAKCNTLSAGSRMPRTNASDLLSIEVSLPPLAEQRRIVDLVESVDAYISGLRNHVETVWQSRAVLLSDLLTATEGSERSLSDVLVRSIGGVWGADPGGDEVDVTVVRSTEFTAQGILRFQTGVRRSVTQRQLESRELRGGDVLLEKSGGGPDQPVGRVVYVPKEIPSGHVCSNFVQLISPDTAVVEPRYVFLLMWLWHRNGRTLEYQAQTTGIRNLRTPDYLAQEIRIPALAEQRRIVDLIATFDNTYDEAVVALERAIALRGALLSDLLSGGHEIPATYDELLAGA